MSPEINSGSKMWSSVEISHTTVGLRTECAHEHGNSYHNELHIASKPDVGAVSSISWPFGSEVFQLDLPCQSNNVHTFVILKQSLEDDGHRVTQSRRSPRRTRQDICAGLHCREPWCIPCRRLARCVVPIGDRGNLCQHETATSHRVQSDSGKTARQERALDHEVQLAFRNEQYCRFSKLNCGVQLCGRAPSSNAKQQSCKVTQELNAVRDTAQGSHGAKGAHCHSVRFLDEVCRDMPRPARWQLSGTKQSPQWESGPGPPWSQTLLTTSRCSETPQRGKWFKDHTSPATLSHKHGPHCFCSSGGSR